MKNARRATHASLVVLSALWACATEPLSTADPVAVEDPDVQLALELVETGLESPTDLAAPSGSDRLFVVERTGRIRVIENDQLVDTPFLDLTSQTSLGFERGVLGLTFHPDYASNGYFYVAFTDANGALRLDRFTVSTDPAVADPASQVTILAVDQPFDHHNGGSVSFGPAGYLYLGLGDGGYEPDDNVAQDVTNLFGTIVRLDVDGGSPYAVPSSNPFATQTGRGEIWAYGLRNPWRFSIDPVGNNMYIGDVGEVTWEEVNIQPLANPGLDYGWSEMEGAECRPGHDNCSTEGHVDPAVAYSTGTDGCSVIGGHVYRGTAIPEIVGHYFYSDWCGGWLRSLRYADGEVFNQIEWDVAPFGQPVSFGLDGAGELYVVADSEVYRLVAQ